MFYYKIKTYKSAKDFSENNSYCFYVRHSSKLTIGQIKDFASRKGLFVNDTDVNCCEIFATNEPITTNVHDYVDFNFYDITDQPDKFKFEKGQVVFYEVNVSTLPVLYAGIIQYGYNRKGETNGNVYKVNDTKLDETQLFASEVEYNVHKIVSEKRNFVEELENLHNDIFDRNNALAEIIMTSREVNGKRPNSITIKIDNITVVKDYTQYETNKFVIRKNGFGEYDFCFVVNDNGKEKEIEHKHCIFDTHIHINEYLERYVVNMIN